MCGIAGFIVSAGKTVDPSVLAEMSEAQKHRGPDDHGYMGWRSGGSIAVKRDAEHAVKGAQVAFAHRRLSIIEEGVGGWQPMSTSDGRYAITFNGEIYNYVELRRELEVAGQAFDSHSDTEVLLRALAAWGVEETLPRLVGMFAFALLDTEKMTVTLARDPFGIKPLFHAVSNGGLAFASEISALLCVQGLSRAVNPGAMYDYMRFGITDTGGETLFNAVRHLPPAHFAVVDLRAPDRVHPRRYWRAELKPVADITFPEATETLRDLFVDSVRLHLRADVPVGAALSGGIDSSAVVAAMRALEGGGLDLHTFTFTAPGTDMNEEHWAEIAARSVGAHAHTVAPSGRDLMARLDDLIITQGEPFGTTSIFAQNEVFALARRTGIKVTLDGQGADEIMAGYVPFLAARLATLMKRGQWIEGLKFLNASGAAAGGRGGVLLRAMRFLLPLGLQGAARRLVGEELVPAWMNRKWFEKNGFEPSAPQKPVDGDVLRHELVESLTNRVLPSLLRYQDRNSMAHSVESRVPFLTTKLVEFMYSLPENYLISPQGEAKAVFRAAMRGMVPDAILDRRDKIGFAVPEEKWLCEAREHLDSTLSVSKLRAIPFFHGSALERELEAVHSGRKPLAGEVWRWINLVRWAENYNVEFNG